MTKKGNVQWEQAEVVVHAVSPQDPFREFEIGNSSSQEEEESLDSTTYYQVPAKRQRPNRTNQSNVSVRYEPEIEMYETITPIEKDESQSEYSARKKRVSVSP